jgi:NADPH-dependent glutamate synthase beta subunit-like oxidoreductase
LSRASDHGPIELIFPQQLEKLPPCRVGCPSGTDIRGWIATIAQRRKLGLSDEEAFSRAWEKIVEVNPFPATLGRVCPHPCQTDCNRHGKEGGVSINAMERFLGDWALDHDLALPRLEDDLKPESVGVIGAGPAGLSFAYQMARRGYAVTVYEKREEPGGMLRYGIPRYRLPKRILAAEIRRIEDLGVDVHVGSPVGGGLELEELRRAHRVLFLGIGAQHGRRLGIPGEDGSGVQGGTDYLNRVNSGERVNLGPRVVVVGGGNTAVDAARAARRGGSRVTILYRRTRQEMPAITDEVEDAIREGIILELLAAPVRVERDGSGRVRALAARRMHLGEPDASGRRSPVPIEDSDFEIEADAVIPAVSQTPEWEGLEAIKPDGTWIRVGDEGLIGSSLWAGGDVLGLGIVTLAIAQARYAAEAVHADLRGLSRPHDAPREVVGQGPVKLDYYAPARPVEPPRRPEVEWLSRPDDEIQGTISEAEVLQEAARCLSCGQCFGCEQCWMYCPPMGFTRLEEVRPGAYFALSLDACEGCGKCIEVCPCGFLSSS